MILPNGAKLTGAHPGPRDDLPKPKDDNEWIFDPQTRIYYQRRVEESDARLASIHPEH